MAMIWRGFYFYRRRMDRRRVLRALAFLLMALALTVLFIAATQMRPAGEHGHHPGVQHRYPHRQRGRV